MLLARQLQAIIRLYQKWKRANPDLWIIHCQNQKNIADAINVAALSENANGKKHYHQYRLKRRDMLAFENKLISNLKRIQASSTFDILLNEVTSSKVKGIGEMAIYDTAVRIGAFLNLAPQVIYLHAGTRIGAETLLAKSLGEYIRKSDLPPALSNSQLSCYELEDLLCIHKDDF